MIKPEIKSILDSALEQRRAGSPADALSALDLALRTHPREAALALAKAQTLREMTQIEAALKACHTALRFQPDLIEGHVELATLLIAQGKWEKAAQAFDSAIRLSPENAELYQQKGDMHGRLGQMDTAAAMFTKELQLRPKCGRAWVDLGRTFMYRKRMSDAEHFFLQATRAQPDYAPGWQALGSCMGMQNRPAEAVEHFRHALRLDPNYVDAWNDLGVALQKQERFEEALPALQRAAELAPKITSISFNVMNCLNRMEREEEALVWGQRTIDIDPRHADAHGAMGLTLLRLERFKEGWSKYEWRIRAQTFKEAPRQFPGIKWDGTQSLRGQTILIYDEQGLGDAIQFIRYATLLVELGARVLVEARPALRRIVQTVEGVAAVYERGGTLPSFDFYASLMSLPMACGTELNSIPARVPYIHLQPEWQAPWPARLGSSMGQKRVGIVWAGTAHHVNDKSRSIRLEVLKPISTIPGIQWVNLQMGEPSRQRVADWPMLDFTHHLNDYADTAGLLSLLDLVITVDTSVAHLAGALGRQVWVLLPSASDWRWLKNREDSPWYPTMRLFRKKQSEHSQDWSAVVALVRDHLAQWTSQNL